MRRILTLIIVLVLMAPIALAAPNYWVVVPASGEAMDVVNGANFAASMKGSAAVTFESREYVDAIEEVESIDRDELVAVVFIGDSAELISGDDRNALVYDNVVAYLEREGFTISYVDVEDWRQAPTTLVVSDEEVDDYLEEQESEESELPLCSADVQRCWDGSFVGRQPALDCEFAPCPPGPQSEPENPERVEDVEESSPNVFVRIWSWFRGIFN